MNDQVRFGVVGLRRGQSFVRMCSAVGGARVTALYDVDLPRSRRAAAELGASAFGSYDELLSSDVDAVVIASPLPYHARQAVAALEAGKHVLSEVTACQTTEDARELVRAVRASGKVYALAENYTYLDEVELVKRLHDDGRFGDVYYGEGEYLHDCRDLWYGEDGGLTWRGMGQLGVYCTHSLGPLLYIVEDRVVSVSALAVPGGRFDPRVTCPTMDLMQMVTVRGLTLRVRVDHVSPRPHQMAYYALQGTRGCYEAWRGLGDESKVWLEDEHEPSRFHAPARWHPLAALARRYIPDRLEAPPGARAGGHGTSEYWMLRDFLAAVREEAPPRIDVYRALDYTLPGICAVESQSMEGMPVRVSDPRGWGHDLPDEQLQESCW